MTYAPANIATRPRHVTARFDLVLLATTLVLAVTGVIMIYSATRGKLSLEGLDPHYYLKRQAVFLVIGVMVMAVTSAVRLPTARADQHAVVRGHRARPTGRAGHRLLCPGVGSVVLARPLQLQPSEFATVVLIIAIATYCSRRPEGLDFRDLVRLVLMAAVPILLVIKQPDLGTGIVMTIILMVMLAVAGMPGRYLVLLIVRAGSAWCCSHSTWGC